MDQSEVKDSNYCRRYACCCSWIRCETLHGYSTNVSRRDGKSLKSCQRFVHN
ncbi:hypothetical protein V1508DRAFT_426420 [Lipomyces doorenjongii]|uniref:uncharacterized protein n=1 Tax=Lipomyces doorenjongii TaxID=383834 RepID=UPI0034CF498A